MPGRRARSPGLGLDKFEAQALGLPKLWSRLLGLGLGLACQGLRARACTSLELEVVEGAGGCEMTSLRVGWRIVMSGDVQAWARSP